MARIEVRSEASVSVLEGPSQRFGLSGNHDQVDVIRHQAVTDQREGVKPALALEQVEVDESVGIGFEDALARVSALCDMVRDIDCDDASESGHKRK